MSEATYQREYMSRPGVALRVNARRRERRIERVTLGEPVRELNNARNRRYAATEKGKAAARMKTRRRTARVRAAGEPLTGSEISVLLRDPCVYCGGAAAEIDHIVPVAIGGDNGWDNAAAICAFCNRSKKDRSMLEHLLASTDA